MKINTNPVRGTRDFGPDEMLVRDYVKGKIEEVYRSNGFTKIQTPVLENINLLQGSQGGENLKLIYKILKRGRKLDLTKDELREGDLVDMGLRYDLTLPLSRFYGNNSSDLPTPFRSIQIGEVFRAERPQKGRYRSLVQCDIDIIGEESELAEMELITITAKALLALQFTDFTIRINDRRILQTIIRNNDFQEENIGSVCISLDKQDKVGWEGVREELLAKGFDAKNIEGLITELKDLKQSGRDGFQQLDVDKDITEPLMDVMETVNSLAEGQFRIIYDPTLIRGMGYYTGMVFEIDSEALGCSIGGGGRYDNMVGRYMKNEIPAVGFSIGFERIVDILMDEKFKVPNSQKSQVVLYSKLDNYGQLFKEVMSLRNAGKRLVLVPKKKKLGKQLQQLYQEGINSYYLWEEGKLLEKSIKD